MKILIYGMDAADGHRLGRALRRLDHAVLVENDGEKAIARIEEAQINVVISDGRIPKFAWIDLCRQLRADRSKPYVYFLLVESPWAGESHEEWACAAGVDDFLHELANERELRCRLRLADARVGANHRLQQLESGMLVCRHCKRIGNEFEHWQEIEGNIGNCLGKQLNLSICPDCYIKNFGLEFRTNRLGENLSVDRKSAEV